MAGGLVTGGVAVGVQGGIIGLVERGKVPGHATIMLWIW